MDLTEIQVELKSIHVSIVRTTMRDIVIDDDSVDENDRHHYVEVKLAHPYMHVNCIMKSVTGSGFNTGDGYIDDNKMGYRALDHETIALITDRVDTFTCPKTVYKVSSQYKESHDNKT